MYYLQLNDSTNFYWLNYKCGTNKPATFSNTEYRFAELHF